MDINSIISGPIGRQIIGTVTKQLGIDENQAQSAVSSAIPLLVSALSQNAQNGKADEISNALEKHDGSILDNITSLFSQPKNQEDGLGIISHILGNKQQNIETAISEKSGLSTGKATQILVFLAPIIMNFLGKQKGNQNLDSNGIKTLLSNLVSNSSSTKGMNLGGLEKLFDQDRDGKLGASDIMGVIGSFLKK